MAKEKTTKKAAPEPKKKGRPKNIQAPEDLWGFFVDYREGIKGNPLKIEDYVGKDAKRVHREKEKPLTFIGFQNYLDDRDIISDVTDYFENKEGRYADFVRICSRIQRNIKEDQIIGGMAGIYNPSITQRLNGLVDKTETTVVEQPLFPDED
jgi:hypothetical protein